MRIEIVQNDITKLPCDAIVNAANRKLCGGGGVDGAIHRAGGESILNECQQIIKMQGECPPGEAVITGSGFLPCNYVIHTVGPIWRGGAASEEETLRRCYLNSLNLAVKHGVRTIAFPAISTGVYGYPRHLAARVAWKAVHCAPHANALETISFVLFTRMDCRIFKEAIDAGFA